MNDQLSLALRDDGISRAVKHADAVTPKWSDKAFEVFRSFARTTDTIFITEDVRMYAKKVGLPDPPDCRAWGGIAVRMRKAGLIVPAGFKRAGDPKVHCSINPAWRRAEK